MSGVCLQPRLCKHRAARHFSRPLYTCCSIHRLDDVHGCLAITTTTIFTTPSFIVVAHTHTHTHTHAHAHGWRQLGRNSNLKGFQLAFFLPRWQSALVVKKKRVCGVVRAQIKQIAIIKTSKRTIGKCVRAPTKSTYNVWDV